MQSQGKRLKTGGGFDLLVLAFNVEGATWEMKTEQDSAHNINQPGSNSPPGSS